MRDFERPGRSLAVGRYGMAATSHPTATLVALDMLKAGGNAIDAAVAACAVQCVVEAGSTGVGGDCFALLSRGGSTDIIAYNGWYRAPGFSTIDRNSPHAVTVPGAVEAWARLVADHGRLTLAELLRPAIEIARDGYPVTPRVAHDLATQADLLRKDPVAAQTFLADGEPPAVGALQRQPALAATLQAIADGGIEAFYQGPVAQDMVEHLQGLGGLHTLEDFAATAGEYVSPISTTYRGHTVYECPPNGQGIIALLILNILARFDIGGDPLGADNLHREIEATRLAYAARDRFLGDPRMAGIAADHLLSDALADDFAARIDLGRVIDPIAVPDAAEHKDTVYITVVDAERNAVSFINSIFTAYGSGLMSPRTGVLFHNRGQSFSLKKEHPNEIAPGKRPMHTIIPGMVAREGRVVMPFGVMGGQYQAMGHAHFLSKVLDFGLDLQSAMDLPRLFPLPGTKTVEMEARLRETVGPELTRRGFAVQPPNWAIGGAQAIWIDWERGVLLGGSDHRKDGCALAL